MEDDWKLSDKLVAFFYLFGPVIFIITVVLWFNS